jgi:hypothetical protein
LIFLSGGASAKPLLDLTGRVALLDGAAPGGVKVTLGLDLDRDGTLNSFELVEADVADDGSYAVSYTPDPTKVDLKFLQFVARLAADYEARGFAAVLDDGPLPIVLRFEREGYSTIVKRFTTLYDLPSLDVVMAPLAPVHCASDSCMAPDGSVRLSGFPGGTGIARAYARGYEPGADRQKFPGSFSDSANNLLISSGFVEVDLRASNGDRVSALSAPVSVRFKADPAAWASLRDLTPNSGKVEVPMYSFDETLGTWKSERSGELEDESGAAIAESDFASISDGSYSDPVYVAFDTTHFSTFNCDAPTNHRACVQGRLVTLDGQAVVGAQVSVEGVSYTGTAGTVFTGADGYFASDLMKSEATGEDVDGNGKTGETFQARVTASGTVGVFMGDPFDSPQTQGSIGAAKSCTPPGCDCIDIGDVGGDFELPRACAVTVHVTYSGTSLTGSGGPYEKGDAIASVKVTGELSGGTSLPLDDSICGSSPCNSGHTDADGSTTFVVPVVGDAPSIRIRAEYSTETNGTYDYYTGGLSVTGCGRADDTLGETIEVAADHASLGDLGDYIASLGAGPAPMSDGGLLGDLNPSKLSAPKGCACRIQADDDDDRRLALGSALVLAFGYFARQRARKFGLRRTASTR